LLMVALAVKLSTGGPVLFRQPRVGLDGHEFEMLKFRTMRGTPDEDGESDAGWAEQVLNGDDDTVYASFVSAGANRPSRDKNPDDRRTGVGRLLRRLSLDELPQLWNVLNGDMSLIGPRPERVNYVRQSGITGWAQVHGLRGQTSLAERVELDNYYIAHWSLGLDVKILVLTVAALFRSAE